MKATIECIICGSDQVKVWGGHVHGGHGEKIIAGRCKEHADHKEQEGECLGCYGAMPKDIKIDPHWSKFGYIDSNNG